MKANWVLLSLIGLFSLSLMSFLITFLSRKGYPVSFILLSIGIMFVIFYSFQTFVLLKYRPELRIEVLILLIVIGILSCIGNIALFQAANDAPNPGLAIAIVAGAQAGIVALLAFIILKDRLTTLQILGLFLAIISVFLITFGQSQNSKKISAKSGSNLNSNQDK